MTSAPPGSPARRRLPPPERRRRGDVLAAVAIVAVLIAGAVLWWRLSPVEHTTDTPAAAPVAAPPPADGVPAGFTEAWHAPSGSTPVPVAVGGAVVTASGSEVDGRDARTGAVAWSYRRDLPLCTVAAGFPDVDGGEGRLLALYQGATGWCSELTALHPATGTRAAASNPDLRPGTRLIANGASVAATGARYLEVWRSDLVRTLEYGDLPTPVQVGKQPHAQCTHVSTALGTDRIGVVERCPGESTDRLTVVATDGSDGPEAPQVHYSVPLPAAGAVLVALTADRAAIALPGPARLLVLDAAGKQVAEVPLDLPGSALAAPDGVAPVTTDGERDYWWAGGTVVALGARDLTPVWTASDTLGPPLPYGGGLLAPVPGGLAVLDAVRGTVQRTIAVRRDPTTGPVRLAAQGEVLLERRDATVVALLPVR